MSYRFRVATWVVFSCVVMIAVMIFAGHRQLEEELREGRIDRTHSSIPGWTLHNSASEEEIQEILGEMLEAWAIAALPMIAIALGGGLLLAKRSLKPVDEINRQIAGMRPDSLHGGIVISEADPVIANLASHLNVLLEKSGAAYREMSEFSARVAHEIRTPLMLLRIRMEHAPTGTPPEFLEDIQDEIARLSRYVERSLVAAKAEQGVLKPTPEDLDLSELIRSVAEDYRLLSADRGLRMALDIETGIHLVADPDFVRQALHGLLENAVRYAHSQIRVSCSAVAGIPVLTIRNDCDPATMATPGLGLGLRVIAGICKASGFRLEHSENKGEFTACIRFLLVSI
jgi:signal transduction histidine kinase